MSPNHRSSHLPGPHFSVTTADSTATRYEEMVDRAVHWLVSHQHADGHWCGELEGDSILQSEYILLMAFLQREQSAACRRAARQLLIQQQPDGSWGQFPGAATDISASVKAYFALKLTGHDPASPEMDRARKAIRLAGGADAVNSFTRFYLAMLGQIDYAQCPAVPPEAVLLPDWAPINLYRVSAWSRTILVPLSILWARRPVRHVPAELGIEELMLEPPRAWPTNRCPGLPKQGWKRWDLLFLALDRTLKLAERWSLTPLRRRALRAAEDWMLERFAESDGLGAIFPPIVWSILALRSQGYGEDAPEVRECHRQLEALAIDEGDTRRLQPCKSPVWDTALTLRALAAAGETGKSIDRGVEWLLAREVRRSGDWSRRVDCPPAGWCFEYRNAFYPDVDDTIMVMMALREALHQDDSATEPVLSRQRLQANEACERARRWVLAMQNVDGGWGAFDRDNDAEFLCQVPFADHNAMIDPSTPDITARVLEAIGQCGMTFRDRPVARAVDYLRREQCDDGSWFGRWGVNYLYGTWQVLVGLREVGCRIDDPMMERGADWLLQNQQEDGGWGESARSYEEPELAGSGPTTPSQTAWAMLGLMAAGRGDDPAMVRAADYLQRCQRADGTWEETEFTGTGFPRVFYLRYHMYPSYFPLLALGQWRPQKQKPTSAVETVATRTHS